MWSDMLMAPFEVMGRAITYGAEDGVALERDDP